MKLYLYVIYKEEQTMYKNDYIVMGLFLLLFVIAFVLYGFIDNFILRSILVGLVTGGIVFFVRLLNKKSNERENKN